MREIVPGDRFNRLTVIRETRHPWVRGRHYLCKCDCGNECLKRFALLNNGEAVSCGCANRDKNLKHGMTNTPEHRCWSRMKERCYNPSNKKFPIYGGRGIGVCERWLNDFPAFLQDMGARPTPKHSIERIDSNGNYEPSNCRWATSVEQNSNRPSFNRYVEYRGEHITLAEAGRRTGIPQATIRSRLEYGWSDEEAVGDA